MPLKSYDKTTRDIFYRKKLDITTQGTSCISNNFLAYLFRSKPRPYQWPKPKEGKKCWYHKHCLAFPDTVQAINALLILAKVTLRIRHESFHSGASDSALMLTMCALQMSVLLLLLKLTSCFVSTGHRYRKFYRKLSETFSKLFCPHTTQQ